MSQNYFYFNILILVIFFIGPVISFKAQRKTNRIIGGRIVRKGEFPFIVSIGEGINEHFCGGIILNQRNILTAAHCFYYENKQPMSINQFVILAGDVLINTVTPNLQELLVFAVVVHPDYDLDNRFHDVAVARLEKSIQYTDTAMPAILVEKRVEVNVTCTVAGWGVIRVSSSVPHPYLLATDILIHSFDDCMQETRLGILNETITICAADKNGGHDACQGDSGGPLICNNKVAGIISFGYDCGLPDVPAIYSDVSFYRPWIVETIRWNGKTKLPRTVFAHHRCRRIGECKMICISMEDDILNLLNFKYSKTCEGRFVYARENPTSTNPTKSESNIDR